MKRTERYREIQDCIIVMIVLVGAAALSATAIKMSVVRLIELPVLTTFAGFAFAFVRQNVWPPKGYLDWIINVLMIILLVLLSTLIHDTLFTHITSVPILPYIYTFVLGAQFLLCSMIR